MKGKFDEAIGHFHQAIRFKPKYASAHSNLGNALAVQHKLEEAIRSMKYHCDSSPTMLRRTIILGMPWRSRKRLAEATVHYVRAIKLNSENPEAHFNLGNALARQGKDDEPQPIIGKHSPAAGLFGSAKPVKGSDWKMTLSSVTWHEPRAWLPSVRIRTTPEAH